MISHDLVVETVPVSQLRQHPENPRRGNVEKIKESLERNGQYKPLVVSRATGYVLAGNHTLRAAIQLGWETIAVVYVDNLTPAQEKRILLADNRTSDLADYEQEQLLELLRDLDGDLEGTGYTLDDQEDLEAVLGAIQEVEAPETDAHYNETEEQMQARAERLSNYQSLKAQGLVEVILVMSPERREQLYEWLDKLRAEWGQEMTNGEAVYMAIARFMETRG